MWATCLILHNLHIPKLLTESHLPHLSHRRYLPGPKVGPFAPCRLRSLSNSVRAPCPPQAPSASWREGHVGSGRGAGGEVGWSLTPVPGGRVHRLGSRWRQDHVRLSASRCDCSWGVKASTRRPARKPSSVARTALCLAAGPRPGGCVRGACWPRRWRQPDPGSRL